MKKLKLAPLLLLLTACTPGVKNNYDAWSTYLGGPDRNHYSTLSQIDTSNVNQLKIAWTYNSPDSGQMQMNPIMVNGILYGVSSKLKAFALDAATGKELWIYKDSSAASGTSRGVAYWEEGDDKRIFFTVGANLIALNALDGKPVASFGDKGKTNLHEGLPFVAKDKFITSTTPGTIYKNKIIMPVRVAEDAGAAPGTVQAFDTRSGKLAWTFHTIPEPGEKGFDTWPSDAYQNLNIGAVNNWAGMALDEKTGTIFIPLGSAAPDFYGVNRKGANLFSDCLLALDADNGKYKWHFQMIHHDLWDRDPPAPPNLITVTIAGKRIDAVAQTTKQGYTFVLDRNTGESLFPVNEVAVPASILPGEQAWATQPVPALPKPFAREAYQLKENDISPYAGNREELKKILMASDRRLFAPPFTTNTLLLPGYDGGMEYGGAAADPDKGILYVNANEMAWFLKLEAQKPATAAGTTNVTASTGEQVYGLYCSTCHGKEREGNALSGYPKLVDIGQRQTAQTVSQIISIGKGKMSGLPTLPADYKQHLLEYLMGTEKKEARSVKITVAQQDAYKHTGYLKFLDNNGLPAITPPWGTLTAIDLNSGKHLWQITLGTTPTLPNQDTHPTGCENYGGAIVTANGLLLIAATKDGMFRAFNKFTGQLIWQTKLPAASFATPAMYSVNGKQYIVLACGGEKLGTEKGNQIVAFALE